MMCEVAAVVKDCGLKLRQGVVASKTFYNAVDGRFNTIIRQNETDIFQQKKTGSLFSVWFGKALAFFVCSL